MEASTKRMEASRSCSAPDFQGKWGDRIQSSSGIMTIRLIVMELGRFTAFGRTGKRFHSGCVHYRTLRVNTLSQNLIHGQPAGSLASPLFAGLGGGAASMLGPTHVYALVFAPRFSDCLGRRRRRIAVLDARAAGADAATATIRTGG